MTDILVNENNDYSVITIGCDNLNYTLVLINELDTIKNCKDSFISFYSFNTIGLEINNVYYDYEIVIFAKDLLDKEIKLNLIKHLKSLEN